MIRSLVFSFLVCTSVSAQTVVPHPDLSEVLERKWQWAEEHNGTYWIGYRMDKLMARRAFYGTFRAAATSQPEQSLFALIGEPHKYDVALNDLHRGWRFNGISFIHLDDGQEDDVHTYVLKEVAILMKYVDGKPVQIRASNMSLSVDFDSSTLYWLDYAKKEESIAMLKDLFSELNDDAKEDLVTVLAIHGPHPEVEQFLTQVVQHNAHSDVREQAAFALGQQDTETGLAVLQQVIQADPSTDVREKAIFAISNMTVPAAQETLIKLARHEPMKKLRKHAIFALGQKASRKGLAVLQKAIYNDADSAIQAHAVHALAQFDTDTVVPLLIDIAHNHSSAKVRKRAIFTLGEIGNEEAVEALIDIVENR